VLAASRPEWAVAAAALAATLAGVLGDRATRVEHVGSTAVPGLPARPVVDVLLAVTDPADPAVDAALARLGFQAAGGDVLADVIRHEGHAPDGTRADVWVVASGSRAERDTLLFVAFLRSHPVHADSYVHHKDELRLRVGDDPAAYGAAKGPFVAAVLADAERWAAARDWRPEHAGG
jgi:GrpB-like predicted nucleotidyltransferase (UPF0157 family)